MNSQDQLKTIQRPFHEGVFETAARAVAAGLDPSGFGATANAVDAALGVLGRTRGDLQARANEIRGNR